jgi:hypothetical protein
MLLSYEWRTPRRAQVDKLRRAQIIEREWKGAETEELKGALDAARKALKASRKA